MWGEGVLMYVGEGVLMCEGGGSLLQALEFQP